VRAKKSSEVKYKGFSDYRRSGLNNNFVIGTTAPSPSPEVNDISDMPQLSPVIIAVSTINNQ